MADQGRLSGLLSRACAGEGAAREAAMDELLRLLMIYIRAGMGRRLRDHRESVDVCQSLARSFVEDFEAGKLEFPSEAALAGYIQQVVRSKLADLGRHDGALKRGGGAAHDGDVAGVSTGGAGPASVAAAREGTERAMAQLTPEEQELVRLRGSGVEWEVIARQLGGTPTALRQQYSRVQRRLGGEKCGD
jgi:DNA-directed RNA polymerase specialized sigma24 family protein